MVKYSLYYAMKMPDAIESKFLVKENQLAEIVELLEEVAIKFQQKCIRFVYKGEVYYIDNKELP